MQRVYEKIAKNLLTSMKTRCILRHMNSKGADETEKPGSQRLLLLISGIKSAKRD